MNRPLIRLAVAACLFAAPLAAQEVAPFALPSSTTGAEAVLLNPAALADLEGAYGYLGLQQLFQRTDGEGVDGEDNRSIQIPVGAAWNLGDDWAVGIGMMEAFDSRASFPLDSPAVPPFRKFEFAVREWRGAVAYRVSDAFNVGLALRFLKADYALGHTAYYEFYDEDYGSDFYPIAGSFSGGKDALGVELSALWKAGGGFTLAALLRPEVKFDLGHGDFDVRFSPQNVPDESIEAILHTYFPGGGVKTEAILPLEARIAVTLAPMGPWRFSGELGWTQWSKWDTLSLDYANETVDPDTGDPILSDAQFSTNFQDAFSLTGLATRTFENSVEAYGRLGWQGRIGDDPYGATLRPNDGAVITLGGRFPWKFGEFRLAVDAFYSFGVYSSSNGFEMSRNLLGAGLSVAY